MAGAEDLFGMPIRLTAVLWYCPDEDVSFLAMHTGPVEMEQEDVLAPMLAAGCPGKGEEDEAEAPSKP